ncbi:MAG: DUF1570 domain-containing protein [Planctomycetota bacterium]
MGTGVMGIDRSGRGWFAAPVFLLAAFAPACWALETVTFDDAGEQRQVVGRVLASDDTGAVYLQEDDGAVWLIAGDAITDRSTDDRDFQPVNAETLSDRLTASLPAGFQVYSTPHYLVVYRTSRDFAKWTASMLERLHRAFTAYWAKQGFDIREPEFPLVVIVHPDAASFARAAQEELGSAPRGVVGYYSLKSNRVTMYDLSGLEQQRGPNRRSSLKEINQMLRAPAALPLVSTVVHEATHQIAFNCGLQTRFADLPLWLVEGMAVYFEAPDLSTGRGWRGIGRVNYPRLGTFRRNLGNWNPGSLATLIATNKRLRDPRFAADAYADAWALNYFLIKHRPKQYTAYVRMLSEKPALVEDTADERLAEFREHFGDPAELQRDMLNRMSRLR